jgi:hypothetical protein
MLLFERFKQGFVRISSREWILLSLETIGVLAGILIAFALNEWAQQRQASARRLELNERLFEEARLNLSLMRAGRDTMQEATARERAFATALVRDGTCPPEADWGAVVTVNMFPPIAVQTAAYEELLGAGGLSTVEDPDARKAVADFHSILDWQRRQNDGFRAAGKEIIAVDDPRVTVGFDPEADEPETFRYDRPALCADRAFRARTADRVRDHALTVYSRRELTEYAITACVALAEALGRECSPQFGGPLQGGDAALALEQIRAHRKGRGKR